MADSNSVDVEFLAKFFKKDIRTIQLWAKNEGMSKQARGRYDFIRCVRWRIEKLENENEILLTTGDKKLYEEKYKGEVIKNRDKELAYKTRLGKLIDRKSALRVWTNQTSVIKNNFDFLGNNLIRDLDGVSDESKKRKIIKKAITEAKETVASLDIEQFIIDEDKFFEEDEEE